MDKGEQMDSLFQEKCPNEENCLHVFLNVSQGGEAAKMIETTLWLHSSLFPTGDLHL